MEEKIENHSFAKGLWFLRWCLCKSYSWRYNFIVTAYTCQKVTWEKWNEYQVFKSKLQRNKLYQTNFRTQSKIQRKILSPWPWYKNRDQRNKEMEASIWSSGCCAKCIEQKSVWAIYSSFSVGSELLNALKGDIFSVIEVIVGSTKATLIFMLFMDMCKLVR